MALHPNAGNGLTITNAVHRFSAHSFSQNTSGQYTVAATWLS